MSALKTTTYHSKADVLKLPRPIGTHGNIMTVKKQSRIINIVF